MRQPRLSFGSVRIVYAAACILLPLVGCGTDTDAASSNARADTVASMAATQSPAALTQAFFAAYIAELEANRDPLRTDAPLRRQVSAALLDSLQALDARGEVLDSDPFLLVQDWPDSWRTTVVAELDSAGSTADTIRIRVRLGGPDSTAAVRHVQLTAGDSSWKIRSVRSP